MKRIVIFILTILPFLGYSQVEEDFGGRFIFYHDTLIPTTESFYVEGIYAHPRNAYTADSASVGDIIVDCDCNAFVIDTIHSVLSNILSLTITPQDTSVNDIRSCTGGILRAKSPPNGNYAFPAGVPDNIADCILNFNLSNTYDILFSTDTLYIAADTLYLIVKGNTQKIPLSSINDGNGIYSGDGVLVTETDVTQNAFKINFSSDVNGSYGGRFSNLGTGGTGVQGIGKGYGVRATGSSIADAVGLWAENTSASAYTVLIANYSTANGILPMMSFQRPSATTAAIGDGTGIEFQAKNGFGGNPIYLKIQGYLSDLSSGAEDGVFTVKLMEEGATAADRLTLASTGALTLQGYANAALVNADSSLYAMTLDETGDVHAVAVSGLADGFIGTTNATLTSNRTITNAGFSFIMSNNTSTTTFRANNTAASGTAIYGNSTLSYGVRGYSGSNYGGYFESNGASSGALYVNNTSTGTGAVIGANSGIALIAGSTGQIAIRASEDGSTTNTVVDVFEMATTTSGTAADGYGIGMRFTAEQASGSSTTMGSVDMYWEDATNVNPELRIQMREEGSAETTKLTLESTGIMTLQSGVRDNVLSEVSSTTTATLYKTLPVNTTGGGFDIDVPTAPVAGDWFAVVDSRGQAGSNNITVNFTGATVNFHGASNDYVLVATNEYARFTYVNATVGWVKSN